MCILAKATHREHHTFQITILSTGLHYLPNCQVVNFGNSAWHEIMDSTDNVIHIFSNFFSKKYYKLVNIHHHVVRGTYGMSQTLGLKRKELLRTWGCSLKQQDQSGSHPVLHLPRVVSLLHLCWCLLSYSYSDTCTRYVYLTSPTRLVILQARKMEITKRT